MDTNSTERRAVLTKSVLRASRVLGLTEACLASALGIAVADLAHLVQGTRTLDPETTEGRRALKLVQICIALDCLVGGEPSLIQAWMQSNNESLRAIPLRLIQTSEGLAATLAYLEQTRGSG